MYGNVWMITLHDNILLFSLFVFCFVFILFLFFFLNNFVITRGQVEVTTERTRKQFLLCWVWSEEILTKIGDI